MRRLLLFALILPVALLAVGELLGWRFLRAPAEALLSRELARPLRIEPPFRLHLLGGVSLAAGHLYVAAPAGFALPHFVDADDISLKLRYRDLLNFRESGYLRLAAIAFGRLDARLVRRPDGAASWDFGRGSPGRRKPPPAVDHLQVRSGRLSFVDPGLPADLQVDFAATPGDGPDAAPTARAAVSGGLRGRPLQSRLETSGWLPAGGTGEGARPLALAGEIDYGGLRGTFRGGITDIFGQRHVRGQASLEGASLGLLGQLIDKPLPTTAPFFLRGEVDNEKVWRVDVEEARIGRSRLRAHLRFDPDADPARLDGELTGEFLALADLAPTFGSRDEEGRPLAAPSGRLFPDRRLDLPGLTKLDARIRVDLERVDPGRAFAAPIAPFRARLDLEGGRLGLAEIEARTARGNVSGTLSVDAGQDPPQWRSELAWNGIRLGEWLRPPGGERSPYFTGTLHGRARLTGSGRSTAALLGSLDGNARAFVKDGSLSHLVVELLGLDIAQGLGLALAGDEKVPVQCAILELTAKNGRVSPRIGLIDTPVTLIVADGSVDLGNERLDLRLAAKPKNVSPFTVRSPIRIGGSLENPEAAPEGGPIAARLLGGALLALVNPLAAIIPFIDPGEGQESPCARSLSELRKTAASPGGNFRR